jgi:prepilin-type N-terminal cleavage/methylation domain-containing protein
VPETRSKGFRDPAFISYPIVISANIEPKFELIFFRAYGMFGAHQLLKRNLFIDANNYPLERRTSQMGVLRNRTDQPKLDNAGFTLLEIIAVIVIMSILAVVAVPRYFDLQTQARERAMATGLAEGIGRVNSYFAQQILSGTRPESIVYSEETLGTNLGDFTLRVGGAYLAGAGSTFNITVIGRANTPLAGMTTRSTITKPGL